MLVSLLEAGSDAKEGQISFQGLLPNKLGF